MEEKPNYYAVIPANVRYDETLKLGEKMMYGEITSLAHKTGECWASNNYFAKLYNVTPQAISRWIKNLEKREYISIFYEKEGKRIVKRIIKMVSTGIDRVSTDIEGGINDSLEGYQYILRGYQRTVKENNTSNNITSINNTSNNTIYSGSSKTTKKVKHKYGEYQNVLLTDDELEKLHQDYNNTEDLITYLDEYIEMKGYKAKSHYLCIKKWVVDAVKQKQAKFDVEKWLREE